VSTDAGEDGGGEGAGVAEETAGDVVGVFESARAQEGGLRTLPEFVVLVLYMEVLNPVMVERGEGRGDVVVEHDDVGAGDGFGVGRGEEGSYGGEGTSCS